jgi:hypothetical protein
VEGITMKVRSRSVPSGMAALDAENIAKANLDTAGDGIIHTRRKVTKNSHPKKPKKIKTDFEDAIDKLIVYLTSKGKTPTSPTFKYDQLQLMLAGTFDTQYWKECTIESTTIIEATPGIGAFTGVRDYAYPDATNTPTAALYADGVISSGDPAYYGLTEFGEFHDDALKWARINFKLENKCKQGDGEPMFITITGTIMAEADVRPCRAMLSMIIKRFIVEDGSGKLTTLENPTVDPITAQYLYQMPTVSGPGFIIEWSKKLVYSMRSKKYETAGVDLTHLVCMVAPMPMMGHKYNNNRDILTSISGLTVKAYQIKKNKKWTKYNIATGSTKTWKTIERAADIFLTLRYDYVEYEVWIATSSDGKDWTERKISSTLTKSDGGIWGFMSQSQIAKNSTAWVIVGFYDFTAPPGINMISIITSSDGTTWTGRKIPDTNEADWTGIAILANNFFVIGKNSGGDCYYTTSTNGVTWATPLPMASTFMAAGFTQIKTVNGILFGWSANLLGACKIGYSTDGVNWVVITITTGTTRVEDIIYYKGKYYVSTIRTTRGYFTSTDLSTWSFSSTIRPMLMLAMSDDILTSDQATPYTSHHSEDGNTWDMPEGLTGSANIWGNGATNGSTAVWPSGNANEIMTFE